MSHHTFLPIIRRQSPNPLRLHKHRERVGLQVTQSRQYNKTALPRYPSINTISLGKPSTFVSFFVGDSIDNPSVKPWPTGDTNEASLPEEKYAGVKPTRPATGGMGRTRSAVAAGVFFFSTAHYSTQPRGRRPQAVGIDEGAVSTGCADGRRRHKAVGLRGRRERPAGRRHRPNRRHSPRGDGKASLSARTAVGTDDRGPHLD
jgi:hypothetical protein